MIETTSDATPRGPYRRFGDPDGRHWLVWRISEADVEEIREWPSLGSAWLIFLGPSGETRRLAPVPTTWRRLTDTELHALARDATIFSGVEASNARRSSGSR
jgi:hypothetical protein